MSQKLLPEPASTALGWKVVTDAAIVLMVIVGLAAGWLWHECTAPSEAMNVEKLQRMAGSVRTGGKGTMRRKKKAVHKATTTDDKRLQSTLKRIGVNAIPAIEEVNIFKEDVVIQFLNPKVQASIAANTWVVSGSPQTKNHLLHLLSSVVINVDAILSAFSVHLLPVVEEDDDEVPQLVEGETFEAAADEGQK
nr:nascent polypeptide-associated complex subunit beta-like [Ipomoea batatas]